MNMTVVGLGAAGLGGLGVDGQREPGRDGLQPWAILAPILCIALLTVGVSLIAEGFARTMAGVDRQGGRS